MVCWVVGCGAVACCAVTIWIVVLGAVGCGAVGCWAVGSWYVGHGALWGCGAWGCGGCRCGGLGFVVWGLWDVGGVQSEKNTKNQKLIFDPMNKFLEINVIEPKINQYINH